MRYLSARFVLAAITILVLSGCRSTDSTAYSPSWSFPNLNPFSSSDEAPGYPPKPSSLASTSTPGEVGKGFGPTPMGAGADIAPPYSATPAGSYDYPSTSQAAVSYGTPAAPGGSIADTSPQQGRYDMGNSYAGTDLPDTPASAYPYPGSSNSSPYDTPADSGDRFASRNFSPSAPGTPYAGSTAGASPYDVGSDRYGTSGATSYPDVSPYDTPGGMASPYEPPGTTASPYGAPSGSVSAYDGGAGTSYASPYDMNTNGNHLPDTSISGISPPNLTTPPLSGSGSGYSANAANSNPPLPGYPAPSSAYDPPGTGFAPGTTGPTQTASAYDLPGVGSYPSPSSAEFAAPPSPYSPPGIGLPPIGSPSGMYYPPTGNGGQDAPFRPGSTSDYTPYVSGTTAPAGSSTTPLSYPSAVPGASYNQMPSYPPVSSSNW